MEKEGMNELDKKLQKLKEKKDLKPTGASTLAEEFTHEKEKSFAQIAEDLKARKVEMSRTKNDDYVKDTIYIRKDIYEAFNALCIKQGDKKKFTNEALMDYVLKQYNQVL